MRFEGARTTTTSQTQVAQVLVATEDTRSIVNNASNSSPSAQPDELFVWHSPYQPRGTCTAEIPVLFRR